MARMRKAAALAAVVVLGLGAAACGDDDDSASDEVEVEDTTGGTDSADDAGTDADADTGGDTDTDGDSTSDGGDDDGSSSGGSNALGFASDDCLAFTNALMEASSSVGNVFSGGAGDLEEAAGYFQEVAKNLPDEIRGDFEIFAGAYEGFAKALADADIDFEDPSTFSDPSVMDDLTPALEAFDSAEVQQASDNIERWLDDTCGSTP